MCNDCRFYIIEEYSCSTVPVKALTEGTILEGSKIKYRNITNVTLKDDLRQFFLLIFFSSSDCAVSRGEECRMERLLGINLVTMTTTFIFLLVSISSVLARPHMRPRLTLADLDEDGAIRKNDAFDIDFQDEGLGVKDDLAAIENAIRFDAVDLPSHFVTYDLNRDRRISLNELSIVSGTKEVDAIGPFRDADLNRKILVLVKARVLH